MVTRIQTSALSLSTAALLLSLHLVAVAAQAQPTGTASPEDIEACLLKRGIAPGDISIPGNSDFDVALLQSLIQDPIALPRAYVRPSSDGEVRRAVKCAIKLDVVFCARSGGHSWSASSTCPGIVIDMQQMNSFTAFPEKRKLVIGAGRTIGETLYQLYSTTGQIIPVGTCPGVGVGGYIQGGGMGTLSGALGLLSDNVVSMKVVTPDGRSRFVSKRSNPDLFWALRGGGGGYLGIVTTYKLQTYEAAGTYDNNVYFSFQWDDQNGAEALFQWTKYANSALSADTYIRMTARAGRTGTSVRAVGICWKVSSVEECQQRLQQTELWNVPGRSTILIDKSNYGFLEAQKFFTSDASYGSVKPSGPETSEAVFSTRYDVIGYLSDKSWGSAMWDESRSQSSTSYYQGLIDRMAAERDAAEMRAIGMEFYPLGPKARGQDSELSAFPHRNAIGNMAFFYNGGERSARVASKARIQEYLAPFHKGTYVNYLDVDLKNYAEEYWGTSLDRMREIKTQVDPENRIAHTQPLL